MLSSRCRLLTPALRPYATLREQVRQVDPRELYEPPLADTRQFPEYEFVNLRLQGYDFAPLEKFQGYVHKMSKRFGFQVVDSYGVAANSERIVTYKPSSTTIDHDIELKLYDRWLLLADVPTVRLPIFTQLLRAHAPVGVRISVKEHAKDDDNYRYIPDIELKEKQEELRSLDNPIVRRALGWE